MCCTTFLWRWSTSGLASQTKHSLWHPTAAGPSRSRSRRSVDTRVNTDRVLSLRIPSGITPPLFFPAHPSISLPFFQIAFCVPFLLLMPYSVPIHVCFFTLSRYDMGAMLVLLLRLFGVSYRLGIRILAAEVWCVVRDICTGCLYLRWYFSLS